MSCRGKIEINVKAISILIFGRTVGLADRQTSKTEMLWVCSQCAQVLAMAVNRPTGSANLAIFRILRQLLVADAGITHGAWQELCEEVATEPDYTLNPTEVQAALQGEILPPSKRLREAS